MQTKWLQIWEIEKKKMRKKCKKDAKQMRQKWQKNDSRAGKITFLDFPGRLRV